MTARASTPGTPRPRLVVQSARMLSSQRQALQRDVEQYASRPSAGCLYVQERDAWKSAPHRNGAHQRRLWGQVQRASRLLTASVIDHLNAAALLLENESVSLWAQTTVLRAACEGAAQIAYLLEDGSGYGLRITRGAAMFLSDAAEEVKAARDAILVAPDAPDHPMRQQARLRNQVRKAGITERSEGAGTKATHLIAPTGEKVSLRFRLTEEVGRRFSDRPGLYRHMSGAAHGKAWVLKDSVASEEAEPHLTLQPDLLHIGAMALGGLDAAALVARTYAHYYGHDPHMSDLAWQRRTRSIDMVMTGTG